MKENDINLLVQKLLVSDWCKMDFKLFEQLVKEIHINIKEILDSAHLIKNNNTKTDEILIKLTKHETERLIQAMYGAMSSYNDDYYDLIDKLGKELEKEEPKLN